MNEHRRGCGCCRAYAARSVRVQAISSVLDEREARFRVGVDGLKLVSQNIRLYVIGFVPLLHCARVCACVYVCVCVAVRCGVALGTVWRDVMRCDVRWGRVVWCGALSRVADFT